MSAYAETPFEFVRAAAVKSALGLPRPVRRLIAGAPVVRDGLLLDPEIQMLLRLESIEGRPALETLDPAAARAEIRRSARPLAGRPLALARVEETTVAGADGSLRARLFVPHERSADGPSPLLLFFHGGGWVAGDLDTHDAPCRTLAISAGVRVLSVDYRLAPEHRYPAAADDACAAFAHVHAEAERFGADRERIAVGGDSAGGNLAAVCAQRAAREGAAAPAFQLLVYPVADNSRQDTESYRLFERGFFLTGPTMDWYRGHYFGAAEATLALEPAASPLLADDLSGVAPAHVVTAGFDPLRDEGEAYARRLQDAGVPVILRRHSGLMHAFLNVIGPGRASREAVIEMGGVLRAALAVPA